MGVGTQQHHEDPCFHMPCFRASLVRKNYSTSLYLTPFPWLKIVFVSLFIHKSYLSWLVWICSISHICLGVLSFPSAYFFKKRRITWIQQLLQVVIIFFSENNSDLGMFTFYTAHRYKLPLHVCRYYTPVDFFYSSAIVYAGTQTVYFLSISVNNIVCVQLNCCVHRFHVQLLNVMCEQTTTDREHLGDILGKDQPLSSSPATSTQKVVISPTLWMIWTRVISICPSVHSFRNEWKINWIESHLLHLLMLSEMNAHPLVSSEISICKHIALLKTRICYII